jgi:hypothetical protein
MRTSTTSRIEALSAAVLAAGLALGCVPDKPAEEPPPPAVVSRGPRIDFELVDLEGKALSTKSLADRLSAVAFLATYDVASQAQARILANVARKHVPRVNLAFLFLEAPENQPLVESFVYTLGLRAPAAMADAATIAGKGPFAGLHHVPSIVILDRDGHEAWRHVGLSEPAEIERALRDIERRDGLAPTAR